MSDQALGSTGQILVTQAALDVYADVRGLRTEEARRELTILLTGARRASTQPATGAEGWRARSRALRVDVDAHVVREGALAVVTHVHVRPLVSRGGGPSRERREERRRERGRS